jgi:hypothetical protein
MSMTVVVEEVLQIHTADVDEDELIDGIDVLWEGDEMASGTDQDDSDRVMEEEFPLPPPPSEDDIERQIRDEFVTWIQQFLINQLLITECL